MATNGILDIQETTEDFRDPDMEFGPDNALYVSSISNNGLIYKIIPK